MNAASRDAERQNALRYRKAIQAAELSVLTDSKLLGIPSVRRRLIRLAALLALGYEIDLDARNFPVSHPENEAPMRRALQAAVAAAGEAIVGLGQPAHPQVVSALTVAA